MSEPYEGIGDVLVSMKGKTSEAIEIYRKSLKIRQKLKETNKLDGENANKTEEVSQKIVKLSS